MQSQYFLGFSHLYSSMGRFLPGEPKSGGHMTVTHHMLASDLCLYLTKIARNCAQEFAHSCIFLYFVLLYLANVWKRILFCRLTFWWGELDLIGQNWFTGLSVCCHAQRRFPVVTMFVFVPRPRSHNCNYLFYIWSFCIKAMPIEIVLLKFLQPIKPLYRNYLICSLLGICLVFVCTPPPPYPIPAHFILSLNVKITDLPRCYSNRS